MERLFEAESRLAASGRLVAELTEFVTEHPLRETTRGLLMRAVSPRLQQHGRRAGRGEPPGAAG